MSFFGYVIFVSERYKFSNKEIEGVETEHFEMVFTKLIMTTLCQKNIVSTTEPDEDESENISMTIA